jgi:uncharacterized protein (DUF2141 family)
MRRPILILLLLAALPLTAQAADTCSLTIKIENVTNKGGNLRIGVYDQATFVVRGSKPLEGKSIPAKAGEMVVTFDGLKPGEYGVKTFQDENANGKMDTIMGMMPSEPYGMSNDARPSMAGPPWDEAKFTLKPGANTITIHLR